MGWKALRCRATTVALERVDSMSLARTASESVCEAGPERRRAERLGTGRFEVDYCRMGDEQVRLGRLGEAIFRRWASQGGFTVNQSVEDDGGWDFLIQLPPADDQASADRTADLRPGGLSCFVQVKATRNIARPIPVKLSNWEKLIKHPSPASFVVIEIDPNGDPLSAHVINIGEEWIGRVLRRLREFAAPHGDKVRRERLPLSWTSEERLPRLDGQSLKEALTRPVDDDPFAYAERKRKLVERAGFDDHPYHVTFTLPKQSRAEAFDAMADLAIGTLQHLPIAGFTAYEVRFGLKRALRDVRDVVSAHIQLPDRPRDGEARVEVYDEKSGDRVAINTDFRLAASVFPFLPSEHQKVAFVSEEGSFVVSPNAPEGMATLDWHLELPQPGRAADVAQGARAARLLRMLTMKSESMHVRISADGAQFDIPAVRVNREPNKGLRDYGMLLERAEAVMSAFGIPLDNKVDPETLMRQSQHLALLWLVARPSGVEVEVRGLMLTTPPEDVNLAAGLLTPFARFGDLVVLVVVALIGEPRWELNARGRWLMLKTHTPRVMATRILSADKPDTVNVDELYDDAERTLKAEGIPLVVRPSYDEPKTKAHRSTRKKTARNKPRRALRSR